MESKNSFAHICDTCNCDYLPHTIFRFCLIDFQMNQISFPNFELFTVKSPGVTEISVSQENAFKKSKTRRFFRNTVGSNDCFTLTENNFKLIAIVANRFGYIIVRFQWVRTCRH